MTNPPASRIKYLFRQPTLWIALGIRCLFSMAAILFCRNGVPLDRPELASTPPITDVLNNSIVFLTFFPAGVMKPFLTFRTGNAWVHMWGFHAVTPHVMVDTRLVVHDFNIR